MFCMRRLYSTLPDVAAVARKSSTPRAVRLRRIKQKEDRPTVGPTVSDEARYKRLLETGALIQKDGAEPSLSEWYADMNQKRSRIRGVVQDKVVGRRIYLPNIQFVLVRNHTPPGQPYNPYEATFRIPKSITKLDIRAYLLAVYGVACTYIRTDNYMPPLKRSLLHRDWHRHGSKKNYKRAVVGLVEPFYFPEAMEDMPRAEREARQKWLDDNWAMNRFRLEKDKAKFSLRFGLQPGWKIKTGVPTTKGKIVAEVMRRRMEREELVTAEVKRMLDGTNSESTT